MKRRRHTPEQVVRKLREAERMLGEGKAIPEVAKELEVSENTFHRWRAEYGGMKADDVKRFLADEPLTAYADPLAARAARWARRHRLLVSNAAALLLMASVAHRLMGGPAVFLCCWMPPKACRVPHCRVCVAAL